MAGTARPSRRLVATAIAGASRRWIHAIAHTCYLPSYVFCGRHLLAAKLRRANIDASAGAVEEVARIIAQILVRWPRIQILVRADSSFTREALMRWCEANRVDYVFGLTRNELLVGAIAADREATAWPTSG